MHVHEIIYPADWQTVGPRPEIAIRVEGEQQGLSLSVMRLDDFKSHGVAGAPAVARLIPAETQDPGVLEARVEASLPDGSYVLLLHRADEAKPLALSGINVRAKVADWERCFDEMLSRRATRLGSSRAARTRVPDAVPLFSLITTVYDTEPAYLNELVDMVTRQTFADFEWLLLDNGSERPATIEAVRSISHKDPRVRYFRVEGNIHIIRGNRYLLERARGRYVIPLDSDDLLYHDALEVLSTYCLSDGPADLYFSDEQKVSRLGTPSELIWRPQWSPLYALSTCPAAHIMAYRRDLGLQVGAYSEDYAKGSHDWDTFLRLADAGAKVEHVAEVLYGWRMHASSAALNEGSKDYLERSQREVIEHSLRRRGLRNLFQIERAKENIGYYHMVRSKDKPPRVVLDLVVSRFKRETFGNLLHNVRCVDYPNLEIRIVQPEDGLNGVKRMLLRAAARVAGRGSLSFVTARDEGDLGQLASAAGEGVFAKAIVDSSVRAARLDWIWDAVGTLELDAKTGIVGGAVLSEQQTIYSIGYTAGIDGFFGTPRPLEQLYSVYGAGAYLPYVRRHVTAVYSGFIMLRAGVERQAGSLLSVDSDDAIYGIEFCLRSRALGIRTAYTPRMRGVRRSPLVEPTGVSNPGLRERIIREYGEKIASDPYYSPHLEQSSRLWGEPRLGSAPAEIQTSGVESSG